MQPVQDKPKIKTYVKGTFLLSEDGLEYKEENDDGRQEEKVVEDKIGFVSLQKQIEREKGEKLDRDRLAKRRNNTIVDKPTLIPIKDTPVDPVPQPILDNQKCQRATQEQFEYFQSYISQKEKQRKFEQAQEKEVDRFLQAKTALETTKQTTVVDIVFRKEQPETFKQPKRLVKIKIKKPQKKEERPQRQQPPTPPPTPVSPKRQRQNSNIDDEDSVKKMRVLEN